MAAVDFFLKIDGVEGESNDPSHKCEIDVLSWNWSESRSGRPGADSGAGKVHMNDVIFTFTANKAVPQLSIAVASGQRFPKAILTCRKAGKGQQGYMTWTFADVVVQSFQIGGDQGALVPNVTITLSFSEYNVQYRAQKEDGSLDNAKKAGWDLKLNKKV